MGAAPWNSSQIGVGTHQEGAKKDPDTLQWIGVF